MTTSTPPDFEAINRALDKKINITPAKEMPEKYTCQYCACGDFSSILIKEDDQNRVIATCAHCSQNTTLPKPPDNTTNTMTCPMCDEGELQHKEIRSTETMTNHKTHYYPCDNCPFIGLEYHTPQNAQDMYLDLMLENPEHYAHTAIKLTIQTLNDHERGAIKEIVDLYNKHIAQAIISYKKRGII